MVTNLFRKQENNKDRVIETKHLIELHNVVKAYHTPAGDFIALDGVDFFVDEGEFVAVMGKSGSGKSTLINMISGIDRPTSGEIWVDHIDLNRLSEGKMAEWRGRHVGLIFQFFQLLPTLTAAENIMVAMDFCDMYPPDERFDRSIGFLEQVGLAESAHKLPSTLAGGEQQRVAIARAMANDPPLILADEPTGNLDSATAESILALFDELVAAGKTILMVSHDSDLSEKADRLIVLSDGRIVSDNEKVKSADDEEE